MPSSTEHPTATVLSPHQVDAALFYIHADAHKVMRKRHKRGWLYCLQFKVPVTFERVEFVLGKICIASPTTRFLPVLDDDGQTEGKISMGSQEFDDYVVPTKRFKDSMDSTQEEQRQSNIDKTITALTATLAAKDRTIRTQALLIERLMKEATQ